MGTHSFHLAHASPIAAVSALTRPPTAQNIPGLVHAECMTRMTLGAPIVSLARMQLRNLCMFAEWESLDALDSFLDETRLGGVFKGGWHIRMAFVRRWGAVRAFDHLPADQEALDENQAVAAMTLARMRLPEVPRFIQWGRPVEELVRDHAGTTMSLAAIRYPRTIGTFSIWKTLRDMKDMVHGHSNMARPERHAVAMKERDRKDFHFEFTTLRFRPLSEHGSWKGRSQYLPPTHAVDH